MGDAPAPVTVVSTGNPNPSPGFYLFDTDFYGRPQRVESTEVGKFYRVNSTKGTIEAVDGNPFEDMDNGLYFYNEDQDEFEKLDFDSETTFKFVPRQRPQLFPSDVDEEGTVYLNRYDGPSGQKFEFKRANVPPVGSSDLYYFDASTHDFNRVLGPDDPDEAILKFSAGFGSGWERPGIVPQCEEEEEEEEVEEDDDDEDSSWANENKWWFIGIGGGVGFLLILILLFSRN